MKSAGLIFSLMLSVASLYAHGALPADTTGNRDSIKYLAGHTGKRVFIDKAKERNYDKRIHRYRKNWAALIPTEIVLQNAGNMGLLSLGMGWNYGKHRQWETQLMLGYIPPYKSNRGKVTSTLKQNYIPWSIYLKDGNAFEPLRCGLYVNTVFGHEFWKEQPHRYPKKYYDFLSTEFRLNIFIGEGYTKIIPTNRRKFVKSLTFFYELSTCDLYIRSMYIDHKVRLEDIIGLSLGVKFQLL